jgi:hypothetical protein
MSVEKRAIDFVQRYLKKEFPQVKNVSRDPRHPGYDFIAKDGERCLKIEVKGCSRLWGIPDLYFTEVTEYPRHLVADYLYVVYFIGQQPPQLCRIPRKAIKSEYFNLKKSYRLSGKFKKERMLGRFML